MNNRAWLAGAVLLTLVGCAANTPSDAQTPPPATAPASAASRPSTRPFLVESATVPAPRPGGWLKRHHGLVLKAAAGNVDLYFLGDSITDFWGGKFKANFAQNFGGWHPADFGISADRTEHVLWRITNGEFDILKPKAVVLLIGTNNLPTKPDQANNTPEDTAAGIKLILDTIQQKQPQARIILMAVFPRGDRPVMNEINKVNQIIATYADGDRIKFININDKLVDADGNVPKTLMPDLLHPSLKGYQIWADSIKPTLTEWLGEQPATQPATQPN